MGTKPLTENIVLGRVSLNNCTCPVMATNVFPKRISIVPNADGCSSDPLIVSIPSYKIVLGMHIKMMAIRMFPKNTSIFNSITLGYESSVSTSVYPPSRTVTCIRLGVAV